MTKTDYEITPFEVEQLLTAYNCGRVMSKSDSEILGKAMEVLRRHGDDYMAEVKNAVRL